MCIDPLLIHLIKHPIKLNIAARRKSRLKPYLGGVVRAWQHKLSYTLDRNVGGTKYLDMSQGSTNVPTEVAIKK